METIELITKNDAYVEVKLNVFGIMPINSENCLKRAQVLKLLEDGHFPYIVMNPAAEIYVSISRSDWEAYEKEIKKENDFDLLNFPESKEYGKLRKLEIDLQNL